MTTTGSPDPDAMPPVLVVSLPDSRTRRKRMEVQLGSHGVAFDYIDAVDGRSSRSGIPYSSLRTLLELGRQMTGPELGCAMSHLTAYERLLASSNEQLLVLEDDITLAPEFVDIVSALDRVGDASWDIVTLYKGRRAHDVETVSHLPGGHRLCRLGNLYGTQAYLVRRRAAARLLDVGLPVHLPSDELLFRKDVAGLRVLGVTPGVVQATGTASHIRDDEFRKRTKKSIPARSVSRAFRTGRGVYQRARGGPRSLDDSALRP